ncbi:GNAT family N-acetyltransferase [Aquibacillus kalidii]|uniref:GNAT family N-acetyltransferase n=1 Tax=Aquibacillus kalidii TaxID=2762597 RepID=UPI0016465023|nr:GNAT family N-acetyltransferase [Aquibacillus kalidii]
MDTWINGEFTISTDKRYLNTDLIYKFLSEEAYWSKGIPRTTFERSIANSALCFGLYKGNVHEGKSDQIGFARVISDLATFAYLSDVFVLPDFRQKGLSKWLMEVVTKHPDLQELRRFLLLTKDAHGLYKQYSFEELDDPSRFLQRVKKNPY